MENLYRQAKDQAEKMQRTIQRLANEIKALERKISILDKTAFSIEQERKRTEQQIQELTDKKDRLVRLIATMLSDDNDYTKLKAIVKESIKAVISENKSLISTAFAAVIQTLKANPEKFHLIYNTHTTANESGHVNDNTNAIKYAEFNRDSLSDLVEKNYENLVEALTNNVINTAADSNSTFSLPSSSAFSGPYNQSNTYKIEEPDGSHNSKGDIAD